ncbi:Hypothetical predicted protein [Mytilus galloprovincialis]|uniref:C2 domain-containing protein n=1 Tax=Mytilus galloprovincialis TaxID=29158 RepID=A0A8B6EBS6_MYTGA|nr:Hypothetical predicted protein [Mytilus galloprovincialis]
MAENTFQPGTGVAPATLIELSISCRHLIDSDVFSKSDPIGVLFEMDSANKQYRELGRTEIIWNNLNPDFVKKFVMHYYFEQSQKLKFEIYDVDSKSADLSKHDFLGRMECTLGEIVAAGTRYTRRLLGPKKNSGTIIVGVEELSSCKLGMGMVFCVKNLDNPMSYAPKVDKPMSYVRPGEQSNRKAGDFNRVTKKIIIPTRKPRKSGYKLFGNWDYDRSIKVECYDWDADGGHDFIGEFQTTLRELSRGPSQQNIFECINGKKRDKKLKKGKSYTNSGVIELMSCKMEKVYTFLDYVRGGTQLNCSFAVDFTASNGDPKSPSSLHYMNPYRPNAYQTALRSVGEIIKDYDSDKLFPVLGFGARLPPDGVVSHEFALNGNPNNPYCTGIEGVLEAYNKALHSIQLYGPTNFAPVINHVSRLETEVNHRIADIMAEGPRGRGRGRGGGRGRGTDKHQHDSLEDVPWKRLLGFRKLEDLQGKEANDILLTFDRYKTALKKALEQTTIKGNKDVNMLMLLVRCLAKCCECESLPQQVIDIFTIVESSKFLYEFIEFVKGLDENATPRVQLQNSGILRDIFTILTKMKSLLPKSRITIQGILAYIDTPINVIKSDTTIIDEDMWNMYEELMNREETTRQKRSHFKDQDGEDEPLRHNKTFGGYDNLDHYLDIQYRLLREDFIAPLREGIREYMAAVHDMRPDKKLHELRIYRDVQIISPICNNHGLCRRISFNYPGMHRIRWEQSKHLIYGSLVCLSPDNFKTVWFATVANRDLKNIRKGLIDIKF